MRWLPFKRVPTSGFNIFQKLLASFLLAIIPILLVSMLINRSGESSVTKEITNSLKSNARFYLSSFELEMERVIRMKQQYILDNELQDLMMFHMIYSDADVVYAIQDIERRLQQFQDSSLFVQELKLYIPDLGTTIHNHIVNKEMPAEEVQALERLYESGKRIYPLGDRLILGERYPKKGPNETSAKLWLEVVLSKANMERSLREVATYNGGESLIVDHSGAWSLGSLPQNDMPLNELLSMLQLGKETDEPQRGIGRFTIGDKPYIYAYESSKLLDASLVVYVPENSFLGPIKWYKQLYVLLAVTSLVVMVIFSAWVYKLVHQPMYRLTGAFRRLEKGDFNAKLTYDRKDEFNYLYQQFNKMSGRLQQLIQDVFEQELRLNRAELKQLQAQINPHFLYNILFLLNRIIQLDDMDNAKKLTQHLGQFFRFITRNKEDEVRLSEEIEHIEAYIGIQQLRFGSKLSVELQPIPAEVESMEVPRLILQPIVENAFEYGLEDHLQKGILRIASEIDEGHLLIHIQDNGGGLTDERLAELDALMKERKRDIETTGMVNIHRRLQLKFGDSSGLSVGRSELGGLHVTMRLPLGQR
ncbi:sensor histidine kinase [Cohnella cholangitidis]|uniref:Sensor histidine kinase n=1 Tax=Cohnella cholangitidis TaxID=2598458 RepID=A0A7G5C0C2_9BACL|nr:sensor histidine kinase [Cohnella cholangitidis]QMV42656.1 sensor histidine kinase [Cohnella cholangitidis]